MSEAGPGRASSSGERRVPRLETIYLYATSDCNQRCRHCWVEAGSGPPTGPPLAVGELRRALAPARALGLEWLKVTGGEPFVRSDAIDLVEGFCGDGLAVQVETNGTLIDDRLAGRLAAAGVTQVSVSLDGAVAGTHDGLRRQVGSFDRAVRAIERLVTRGVTVQVLFTLTRENVNEVDGVLERCERLGDFARNVAEEKSCDLYTDGIWVMRVFGFPDQSEAAYVHATKSLNVLLGVPVSDPS